MEMLTTTGYSKSNYGRCLNAIIKNSPFEWIVVHDHDSFFCNPSWFDLIVKNIQSVKNPGLLTCVTNLIGNGEQKEGTQKALGNDLSLHKEYSLKIQDRQPVEAKKLISGVMMVTSRTAWKAAGGFREKGVIGVDNDYHRRIREAGFKVYIMRNVYVYHWYRQSLTGEWQ